MIIEQELMRSIKTVGGLTHGRGLTENSFARWVSSMPQCSIISDSIEKFANVLPTFSEQQKELQQQQKGNCLPDGKRVFVIDGDFS